MTAIIARMLTTDPDDIEALLAAAGVRATVVTV